MLPRDSSSYSLSPFYEPGAPPMTPILIAQTEIGKLSSPRRLLAQEQIGPRAQHIRATTCACLTSNAKPLQNSQKIVHRRSMIPASSPQSEISHKTVQLHRRFATPSPQSEVSYTPTPLAATTNPRSQKGVRFFKKSLTPISQLELPLSSAVELTGESDLSSIPTEAESADEGEELIPKPQGEAGRPGRGGYNLQEALGWSDVDYKKPKVIFLANSHSVL